MMQQPIFDAMAAVEAAAGDKGHVCSISQGTSDHHVWWKNQRKEHITFIAGHAGIDERIRELADDEISLGDYVLTGESLKMVTFDATALYTRCLSNNVSAEEDSFQDNLLNFQIIYATC